MRPDEARAPERALLFACWPAADPLLKGLEGEPALLDVAGKSLAHRAVEQAVRLGARRIDVVLGDQAAPYAAALGSGERWGCVIVCHYLRAGERPLQALARQLAPGEHYLVLQADRLLPAGHRPQPGTIDCGFDAQGEHWCGSGCLAGEALARAMASADSRDALAHALLGDTGIARVRLEAPAGAHGAAALLAAVRHLLANPDPPVGIARRPASPGIWLGNGSRVHPTATLVAPVYLGEHVLVAAGAVIGPDAVVGTGSLVDRGATIAGALVSPGSYVGPGVEIRESILAGDRLVSAALGVSLAIPDRELAGPAAGRDGPLGPGVLERVLAALLWGGLWPLRLLAAALLPGPLREPAEEAIARDAKGAWLRHFRERFHPGLPAVSRGRARIVGPAPRAAAAIQSLPDAWRALYRRSLPGLINDVLLLGPEGADPAIRFAGDALAAKKLHSRHIVGVTLRYACRVGADVGSGRIPAAAPRPPAPVAGSGADRA